MGDPRTSENSDAIACFQTAREISTAIPRKASVSRRHEARDCQMPIFGAGAGNGALDRKWIRQEFRS